MFDDFYGLDARPFQLTPDPEFYFESATHRKALSYLGYGLAQGEGFVVITGEVGAGKSTLVAYLMATIDPARMTAATVVTSALDGEEIVHVVAQSFGLPVAGHDKASALGALEAFFHDEARAGRRCLLIVDEAQNLSVSALEELRMLSNFQLGAHPLLQTLLLGQPEFRGLLMESPGLEQLRQRVIATHHLSAMQKGEVQPYIEHRLGCVGWQGRPAFDPAVFHAIYEATGGIPRRINQLVNRLLLLGAVDQRERLDEAMLAQVLDELDQDGARALVTGPAEVAAPAAAVSGEPASAAAIMAAPIIQGLDETRASALIESALTDRDARIGELQAALVELATTRDTENASRDEEGRIAALEARLEAAEAREPVAVPVQDDGRMAALEARIEAAEAREPVAMPVQDDGRMAALEARLEAAEAREPVALPAQDDDRIAALEARLAEVETLAQAAPSTQHDEHLTSLDARVEDAERIVALLQEQLEASDEQRAQVEARLADTERTLRHTLTMLIEWIESGDGNRHAA